MATMTPRQARDYEHFSTRCYVIEQQPEEMDRWVDARHNAIKAAWTVSLGILFSYLLVIAGIIN